MGMDTGAVAGKSESVRREKPFLLGGDEGGKTEKLLKPLFIMEGKLLMGECVSGDGFRDAGMFIRKFLTFTGLFGRLFVLMGGEKVLSAVLLGSRGLCPEPVHEVKIRPKRGQGSGSAANKDGKKAVSPEFLDPGGKACNLKHQHKDKGTQDLCLVFGRTSQPGIEPGKIFHDGIQVQKFKFFLYSAEFKTEFCAL